MLAKVKQRLVEVVEGDTTLGGHLRDYLERIEYSRAGDGQAWTAIKQGSQGQRSAAQLAFLLALGDEPLVLDQPEDDLDNHLGREV